MAPEKFISARKRKKKDRKVFPSEEPVLTGSIYRGSQVVPDCVKLREALLFEDKFGTFGRSVNFKNDKQAKKQQILDKVWVFAAHHKLESIKRRKFSTLEQERRHTVLNYLTSDRYVERELYTFNLKSEIILQRDGSKVVMEKLCLAFEDVSEALKWRQAIARQIGALRRRQQPNLEAGASRRDLYTDIDDGEEADGFPRTGVPAFRPDVEQPGQPSTATSVLASHDELDSAMTIAHASSLTATGEMITPPETPFSQSVFDDEEYFQFPERATSLENLQAEIRTDSRTNAGKLDDWRVLSSDNNITVLRGREQHNANSIMLSYVIHAPPRLCVKSLLRGSHKGQMDSLYLDIELEESVDAFNDVLLTTWQPHGLTRFFMAPRRLRMRRLWRREDDGSYVTLFTALDDLEQPPPRHWFLDWFTPLSCKLVDTCVTFSPLNSEFSNQNGDSSETLVTHVSCYGDLGGWMKQGHPWRHFLNFVAPFTSASSWSSFVNPHIELGVAIRNKAEAARFCVRPYLQSHNESITTTPAPLKALEAGPSPSGDSGPLCGLAASPSTQSEMQPPISSFAALQPVSEETEGVAPVANGGAVTKDSGRQDVTKEGHLPTLSRSLLTPNEVATCDSKYWTCPGANNLKVRGADYLRDKKKIPAAEPVFSLAATDLLQVDKPTPHIARYLPSLRHSSAPFTFIMQIMFGHPSLSLTFSWAAPAQEGLMPNPSLSSPSGSSTDGDAPLDEAELLGKPFELTLTRFLAGGTNDAEANKRRDGTLKLIPRISQGAWFVKQAVGTTPCLLGRKLTASYHRGPRYFEVDVDVSSSSVAANIVGLVQGLTKSLCVDMAICLEGHSPEELPESLLGTVRCSHLDLNSAKLLDTTTGEIREKSGKLICAPLKQRHTTALLSACGASTSNASNLTPALTL